jgi:hypothetical protein
MTTGTRTIRILPAALVAALATAAAAAPLRAQGPGVPIERGVSLERDAALLDQAKALRESGKLLDRNRVAELLKAPQPARVGLPAASDRPLAPRDIYKRARAAYARVGWNYRCTKCENWHLNLAGGYAIAPGGVVATCYHVLESDAGTREGCLVAVEADGTVRAVTAVLAARKDLDAAIVRVEGARLEPLALNDQAAPGDAAWLFSEPLRVRGYFSTGTVNRFFWLGKHEGDPATLAGAAKLRMNVGTDWAPGSSGAAVLDACGNAIGHVARIAPMSEGGRKPAPKAEGEKPADDHASDTPLITLHEAIPARGVLLLARSMDAAAPPGEATEPAKPKPGSP